MATRGSGHENGDATPGRQSRLARRAATISFAILVGSLGALAVLLLDRGMNGEEPAPQPVASTAAATEPPATAGVEATPTTAPTATPDTPDTPTATATPGMAQKVRYSGDLPGELTGSEDLEPATEGADLAFLSEGEGEYRLVRRYYVPVVAMGTGVDSLTQTQVEDLASGAITDWSDVGGIAGPVRAFAIVRGRGSTVLPFEPVSPERSFATYRELLAAMTLDSGAWAFVPIEKLLPTVTAVAVGEVDIVRGRGDTREWPYVEAVAILPLTEEGKATAEAIVEEHSEPLPEAVTVIATGDILQSRCSLTQIRATGDWGAALRGPVGEYLASADLTLGSIDGSIQDIAEPLGCFSHVNLSSPPEVIEALTLSGFDEVTVATNHVFDCGAEPCGAAAFLRTIQLLEEAGIAVVGGGENLAEALAPAIFEVGGTTFGVLGFDDVAAYFLEAGTSRPGTAPLDDDYSEENAAGEPAFFRPASELGLERFRATVRALADEVDVVIVQVQTGTEDTHDPSPRSIKALRAAVEEGATLVVGNQAHHVQAIEPGRDAFIAYALGNFIYDQTRLEGHMQGYLLEATFWGARLVNLRFAPYVIEDLYRPVFAEGEVRAKILNDVFEASIRLAEGQ
ncbi:MAG: CapA family protein [Chloroflexi bacterium]|nr:CapA family protein [Chloroflexota bacterium]